MIGGDSNEARTEDRVRPGREHLDRVKIGHRIYEPEAKLEPTALADPILLHQPDLLRPIVQAFQPVQQIVGKIGDLQEPLGKLPPLDLCSRAPPRAVDHLFIGKDRHVDGVPIDLALLPIDQSVVEQIEEERLLVPVVARVAGCELAIPVEREPDALELLAHRPDIGPRPFTRMDLALYGRILRRHSKGIPAHGMKHLVPLHPPVAGDHVAHRVIAHVAHVDAPRGIGEHLQHIGPGLVAAAVRAERSRFVPALLPAAVGRARVEAPAGHGARLSPDCGAAEVAGSCQDDVLKLLHRRRRDRRLDPAAVLVDLLGG